TVSPLSEDPLPVPSPTKPATAGATAGATTGLHHHLPAGTLAAGAAGRTKRANQSSVSVSPCCQEIRGSKPSADRARLRSGHRLIGSSSGRGTYLMREDDFAR